MTFRQDPLRGSGLNRKGGRPPCGIWRRGGGVHERRLSREGANINPAPTRLALSPVKSTLLSLLRFTPPPHRPRRAEGGQRFILGKRRVQGKKREGDPEPSGPIKAQRQGPSHSQPELGMRSGTVCDGVFLRHPFIRRHMTNI